MTGMHVSANLISVKKQTRERLFSLAVILLAALISALPNGELRACGLEPMINGGFTVSHPDALQVAVAVAQARESGLLPEATDKQFSNDVILRQMITDLQQMNSRMKKGLNTGSESGSFSVILVGPGLWSHFFPANGRMLARYHTDSPLEDRPTMVTHHAVLQALLGGELAVSNALELGLISFDGKGSSDVLALLEASLIIHEKLAQYED